MGKRFCKVTSGKVSVKPSINWSLTSSHHSKEDDDTRNVRIEAEKELTGHVRLFETSQCPQISLQKENEAAASKNWLAARS